MKSFLLVLYIVFLISIIARIIVLVKRNKGKEELSNESLDEITEIESEEQFENEIEDVETEEKTEDFM